MELKSLTGLRFIAAFSILFAHATVPLTINVFGATLSPAATSLLGMPLFFVLSGFVIHYNYSKLFENRSFLISTSTFLAARVARLYPLMFVALAFALWLDDWMLHVWRKFDVVEILSISYLLNVFSWYPIWVDGKLLIQHNFGVAWSVSTEWFFYAAYIFFARSLGRATLSETIKLIAAVCVLSYGFQAIGAFWPNALIDVLGIKQPPNVDYNNSAYRWLYYVSPYSRIFEFLLGALTAQAFKQSDPSRWPSPKAVGAWIVGAAGSIGIMLIVLVAVMSIFYPNWTSTGSPFGRYLGHLHMNFALAPMIAILIYFLAIRDMRGDKGIFLLAMPAMVALGEISYSLYLIHPISLRIVPLTNGIPNIWFRIICAVTITIAMAIGTYRIIEVPGRRFLRRVLTPPASRTSQTTHGTKNAET